MIYVNLPVLQQKLMKIREMKARVTLALAVTCFALAGTASASIVEWSESSGGNGHYFELVTTLSSWSQATVDAESRSYLGAKGYLASITSSAENYFLTSAFSPLASVGPQVQVWIGGYETPPAGNWNWTSGEQWTYSNWSLGQPNNAGGVELWVALYVKPNSFGAIGQWADAPDNTPAYYIVEYPSAVPVPPILTTIDGGTIAPGGVDPIGEVRMAGDLILKNGVEYVVDLDLAGLKSDYLGVDGTLNLGTDSLLDLNLINDLLLDAGKEFQIVGYRGSDGNYFKGFADGSRFNRGQNRWEIDYRPGGIYLTSLGAAAVPEPSSLALLLLAAGLLGARRRRH